MAETLPDDHLATEFVRFGEQALEEIRPPGPLAVRYKVRHRRTVRVAWAAALVVLASVAIAATISYTADVSADADSSDPKELASRAQADLGRATPGTIPISLTAKAQPEEGTLSVSVVRGLSYDIVALCRGRGSVTVDWMAPGRSAGSFRMTCDGETFQARFSPHVDGVGVRYRLTPDPEAVGQAGIALAIVKGS